VKLRWLEIGPDGGVLLTPYVPLGITGIDDDDAPKLNEQQTTHTLLKVT